MAREALVAMGISLSPSLSVLEASSQALLVTADRLIDPLVGRVTVVSVPAQWLSTLSLWGFD